MPRLPRQPYVLATVPVRPCCRCPVLLGNHHTDLPTVRSIAEFCRPPGHDKARKPPSSGRTGRYAGDEAMTTIRQLLQLGATALALSTQPSRAGTCAQDIDRAWVQVDAKIQARIAAGRSAPQSMIGLLHYQPTPSSIAAAEKALGQGWSPMEAAVSALTRAHEADRADDRDACEQAL